VTKTEVDIKRKAYLEHDRLRAQVKRQKKKTEFNTLQAHNELLGSQNYQLQIALQFATKGYVFIPPAPKSIVDNFKQIVLNHCMLLDSEGTITGHYSMQAVKPSKLAEFEVTRNLLTPLLGTAKAIFSAYLEREVEVYIHSSAILSTPETLFAGQVQRPQVMHADNVGFVAITALIMLSEDGGDSTHILDLRDYGPDVNQIRESLLRFSISDLDPPLRDARHLNIPAIQRAISARYGSLLRLTPEEFFTRAHQQRMSYGEAELFRSDGLHAGPFSMRSREGMFVEIRVSGEIIPLDTNYQFRFPDLLRIAGAPSSEIDQLRRIWSKEGYFFPGDFDDFVNDIKDDEEQSTTQVDVVVDQDQLYESDSTLLVQYRDNSIVPLGQKGLFTQVQIPRNTIIAVFDDTVQLNDKQLDELINDSSREKEKHHLCFLKRNVTLNCWEARRDGKCKASIVNSKFSCVLRDGRKVTPNCKIIRGNLNGKFSAYLRSIKDICPGEEVVVTTYGTGFSRRQGDYNDYMFSKICQRNLNKK
jgi:hypothetical protein